MYKENYRDIEVIFVDGKSSYGYRIYFFNNFSNSRSFEIKCLNNYYISSRDMSHIELVNFESNSVVMSYPISKLLKIITTEEYIKEERNKNINNIINNN